MPLVQYLARFSEAEQQLWAADYLYQLDTLWLNESKERLKMRLSGKPMCYGDNEMLWGLAHSVATGQEEQLFSSLQEALGKGSWVQRMRLLTKAEGLLSRLPPQERPLFLKAFADLMSQVKEGQNWDMFVKLMNKTASWWNKKEGAYRIQLSNLWQKLAAQDWGALQSVLESNLKETQSSWIFLVEVTSAFTRKGTC